MKAKYKVAVWATGGVGNMRSEPSLTGPTSTSSECGCIQTASAARTPANSPGSTRRRSCHKGRLDDPRGDADCVVYAAPAPTRMKEAIGDLCRILAAGKNIVTTSIPGLVYPRAAPCRNKVIDAISNAAEAGRSSLFSSGIEPGFGADLFPIALMSMSHKVYSVRGIEITNYSEYPNQYDMRELFGFGQPLDYHGGLKVPGTLRWGWGAAVTMVGDALGVELDDIREICEFQATPRDIDTAFGLVKAGTVGATRAACIGVVDGQRRRHDRARRPHGRRPCPRLAQGSFRRNRRHLAGHHRWRAEHRRGIRGRRIVPATATAITACWQRACAQSTPSHGCATPSPESLTRCTSRSPRRWEHYTRDETGCRLSDG